MADDKPEGRAFVGTLDGLKTEPHVSDMDEYVAAAAGTPPHDFKVIAEAAGALLKMAQESLGMILQTDPDRIPQRLQDALLVGAYAMTADAHGGNGANRLAFVQRARQVVQWCDLEAREREQTPLEELESRAREIARVVAQRLYRNEEFVVLLANAGEDGYVTWTSSMAHSTTVEVIEELIAKVKEEAAAAAAGGK